MHRMALSVYTKIATRCREIQELDRERGLTTTEIAVLTFVLVTVAAAVGALLYTYASSQVDGLPETPATKGEVLNTGGG